MAADKPTESIIKEFASLTRETLYEVTTNKEDAPPESKPIIKATQ